MCEERWQTTQKITRLKKEMSARSVFKPACALVLLSPRVRMSIERLGEALGWSYQVERFVLLLGEAVGETT